MNTVSTKQRVTTFFDHPTTFTGKIVRLIIIIAIVVSGLEFGVEIFAEQFFQQYHTWFSVLETAIVALFTVEYLLRLWAAERRIKFLINFYNIIDVLAILPFFVLALQLPILQATRVIRLLRLTRLLRLAKVLHYSDDIHLGTIIQENIIKNIVILLGLVLLFEPVAEFMKQTDSAHYADILLTASILGLASMFGVFTHSYATVDARNNFDRIFSHITTATLMLPIGVTFEILQNILQLELGSTSILTYAIWFVYGSLILYDFWNVKRIETRAIPA